MLCQGLLLSIICPSFGLVIHFLKCSLTSLSLLCLDFVVASLSSVSVLYISEVLSEAGCGFAADWSCASPHTFSTLSIISTCSHTWPAPQPLTTQPPIPLPPRTNSILLTGLIQISDIAIMLNGSAVWCKLFILLWKLADRLLLLKWQFLNCFDGVVELFICVIAVIVVVVEEKYYLYLYYQLWWSLPCLPYAPSWWTLS